MLPRLSALDMLCLSIVSFIVLSLCKCNVERHPRDLYGTALQPLNIRGPRQQQEGTSIDRNAKRKLPKPLVMSPGSDDRKVGGKMPDDCSSCAEAEEKIRSAPSEINHPCKTCIDVAAERIERNGSVLEQRERNQKPKLIHPHRKPRYKSMQFYSMHDDEQFQARQKKLEEKKRALERELKTETQIYKARKNLLESDRDANSMKESIHTAPFRESEKIIASLFDQLDFVQGELMH